MTNAPFRRVTTSFLALVLTLTVSFSAFAAGAGEEDPGIPDPVVVATDATWPPMEFLDSDREIIGFDIDLMRAIADAAGFNVEFRNTAWDGIFAGLAAREYDAVISSVTITEERQQNMDFSDPYINAGQVLVVPIDLADEVAALEDMEGMTVGAQIGTTGAMAVQEASGVDLATFDEVGLAFEDLAAGRIDGVVADTPVAANYALQNVSYAESLTIVGEPFTDEFYGVAFPQGSDELREAVNDGLAQVQADGTIDELIEQWLR